MWNCALFNPPSNKNISVQNQNAIILSFHSWKHEFPHVYSRNKLSQLIGKSVYNCILCNVITFEHNYISAVLLFYWESRVGPHFDGLFAETIPSIPNIPLWSLRLEVEWNIINLTQLKENPAKFPYSPLLSSLVFA